MNGCIYRTEHDVCKKYTTDKATSFCVGRNCLDRKPSNADRIRAMTDEELGRLIARQRGWFCNFKDPTDDEYPKVLEWLQAESGDSDV